MRILTIRITIIIYIVLISTTPILAESEKTIIENDSNFIQSQKSFRSELKFELKDKLKSMSPKEQEELVDNIKDLKNLTPKQKQDVVQRIREIVENEK